MTSIEDPSNCFFDTNIVVYSLGFDDTEKTRTAQMLMRFHAARGTLCLSTQVLLETYNTVTRKIRQKATPMDGRHAVSLLAEFRVHTVDLATIQRAIDISLLHQVSLWDALLVASASALGAALIYTEDLNHGQVIEGVRVMNPFLADELP